MRASILTILFFLIQISWGQSENKSSYEYAIVPMQFDFQDEPNKYQLNILARVLLKDKGFKVYMDKEERPLNLSGRSCEPLFLEVEDTSGFLNISVIARLLDCNGQIVFESEDVKSKLKTYKEGYQEALKKAISTLEYKSEASNSNRLETASIEDKSEVKKDLYPDKRIYKFGGDSYWLVKNGDQDFRILAKEGKERYAELENADRGTFIFNSKTINGAAFFDAEGNLNVEYRDEDLDEVQSMVFKKID